jgi:hypothetical protein
MNPDLVKVSKIPVDFGECLGPLIIQNMGIPNFTPKGNSGFLIPKSATTPLIDYYMRAANDDEFSIQGFSAKATTSTTSNTIKFKDIHEFYKQFKDKQILKSPVIECIEILADESNDTFDGPKKVYEVLATGFKGRFLKEYDLERRGEHQKFFNAMCKEFYPGNNPRDVETRDKLMAVVAPFNKNKKTQPTQSDKERLDQAYRFIHEKILEWHSQHGALDFSDAVGALLNNVIYIKSKIDPKTGLFDVETLGKSKSNIPRPKLRGKNGIYRAGRSDRIGIQL